MGRLDKKRALVTGSSSGIGAGVALAFARDGADVVVNYPTPQQKDAAERSWRRCARLGNAARPFKPT